MERYGGTLQGGPLSPLLANVPLDEVDRELERRGHRFVRYADDCSVYVRSRRAGERVLAGLRRLYDRLHLKINEAKTAVASATGRTLLGYEPWRSAGDRIKCAVACKALATSKQRVGQLTSRSGGRSLPEVAERLRTYMPGWKAYFQLVQTPKVFRELDEWVRHRLRCSSSTGVGERRCTGNCCPWVLGRRMPASLPPTVGAGGVTAARR